MVRFRWLFWFCFFIWNINVTEGVLFLHLTRLYVILNDSTTDDVIFDYLIKVELAKFLHSKVSL